MAVRVVEIQPAAAVKVVDLTASGTIEICIERDARAFDPGERRVELALADEEGVVLSAEIGGVGVVERYPVTRPDLDEMRPLRSCLQPEYIGKALGGCPITPGRNNDLDD